MQVQTLDLGRTSYSSALETQRECVARVRDSGGAEAFLLLVEHDPPVITLGRRGREASDLVASSESLSAAGVEVIHASRGGQATYHGPGQLVCYPILDLRAAGLTVRQYVHQLEETIIVTAGRFGVSAFRRDGQIGVWVDDAKLAAIGVAVERRVAYHGLALNVCTDLDRFGLIVPCGMPGARATSLSRLLGRRVEVAEVRPVLLECFSAVFGSALTPRATACLQAVRPVPTPATGTIPSAQTGHGLQASRGTQPCARLSPRLPAWLRRAVPSPARTQEVRSVLSRLSLATVCTSAHCPNRGECFARGTATFLILGDRCTRACRFCAVAKGEPLPPRGDEPQAVAEAAAAMNLAHVVVTSVTRDDLPDGGADHFARTIAAVRARLPRATIEVLTPDFQGSESALAVVLAARPDVFNHNVETVPRLYPLVRPQADYARSLELLRAAKALAFGAVSCAAANSGDTTPFPAAGNRLPPPLTKSGLMLGLGERRAEISAVLRDLRLSGCDIVTIGQYLQPTSEQLPVTEFVTLETFAELEAEANALGFLSVAAGPFVRSSYHAERLFDF